jgi:hypothetical protein
VFERGQKTTSEPADEVEIAPADCLTALMGGGGHRQPGRPRRLVTGKASADLIPGPGGVRL